MLTAERLSGGKCWSNGVLAIYSTKPNGYILRHLFNLLAFADLILPLPLIYFLRALDPAATTLSTVDLRLSRGRRSLDDPYFIRFAGLALGDYYRHPGLPDHLSRHTGWPRG